jgi:nucleoside-diphosphate-sugar epimerase
MRVLIVGGTGLIGGCAALFLREQGCQVSLMSRNPPAVPDLAELPYIRGNYLEDDFGDGRLQGFDALVFAAAADVRNLPRDGSVSEEEFYTRANSEGVPRFFAAARDAGISRAVYIGSFYPQVAPAQIERSAYVKSRHLADEGVRALSGDDFLVCSLNAPYVLGHLPGLDIPHLGALVQYTRGLIPNLPLFAPPGGTNHITTTSLSEAILGALLRGEAGVPYLLGDENYSWKDYLETWARAGGSDSEFEVREEDHPMLPNAIMFAGVGVTVSYEPDAAQTKLLAYGRNRVAGMIREVVEAYGA